MMACIGCKADLFELCVTKRKLKKILISSSTAEHGIASSQEYYTRKNKINSNSLLSHHHSIGEGIIRTAKAAFCQSPNSGGNQYHVYTASFKKTFGALRILYPNQLPAEIWLYPAIRTIVSHLLVLVLVLSVLIFSLYGFSLGQERAVVRPRMWVSCCCVIVRPPG